MGPVELELRGPAPDRRTVTISTCYRPGAGGRAMVTARTQPRRTVSNRGALELEAAGLPAGPPAVNVKPFTPRPEALRSPYFASGSVATVVNGV